MIFLQTERLILRNVEQADAAVMFDYRNDLRCSRYQRGQHKEQQQIEALIRRRENDLLCSGENCMVALALRDTGEMIGEVVVMPSDGSISLGYTLHYRYHRKGYAFEALTALVEVLHRQFPEREILCFVHPENQASCGLLRKLRFEEVGEMPAMESVLFGKWIHPETRQDVVCIQNQR